MKNLIKAYPRRIVLGALIVAVVALTVPISFAIAGSGGTVVVNVEKHNDACGVTQGKKVIGTDTLKRSGNTLYVTHQVHGADPGSNYYVWVYDAGTTTCDYIGQIGKFKVAGDGNGNKSGSIDVSGTSGMFAVCDYNYATSYYDCSAPIAKLGSNQLP